MPSHPSHRRAITRTLALLLLGACAPDPGDANDRPRREAAPPRPPAPDTLATGHAALRGFCRPPWPTDSAAIPAGAQVQVPDEEGLRGVDVYATRYEAELRCTVRTAAQRDTLWARSGSSLEAWDPRDGWMLLVVTGGQRPTTGYSMGIDTLWRQADTLVVGVRLVSGGCEAGMMITYPAAALIVREAAVVRFRELPDYATDC